jgi:hypothetical protein
MIEFVEKNINFNCISYVQEARVNGKYVKY